MRKRAADWLEKISAGAMLVGLFQDDKGIVAMLVSVALFASCPWLTRKEGQHD